MVTRLSTSKVSEMWYRRLIFHYCLHCTLVTSVNQFLWWLAQQVSYNIFNMYLTPLKSMVSFHILYSESTTKLYIVNRVWFVKMYSWNGTQIEQDVVQSLGIWMTSNLKTLTKKDAVRTWENDYLNCPSSWFCWPFVCDCHNVLFVACQVSAQQCTILLPTSGMH